MITLVDTETGRIIINVFIVLMLMVILLYDLPVGKVFTPIRDMMDKTIKWTGLWHGWGMFAPSPSQVNRRLTAEFMLEDGEIIEHPIWDFATLGIFEAVIKGRHRKLRERIIEKSYNILKPSYCHYLVREYYLQQLAQEGSIKEKVVKVWLYDCSYSIHALGEVPDEEEHFYKSWIFTYEVPKNLESELNRYQ